MPQLVCTPEGWFRTHQRDLHLIRPTKKEVSKKEWISQQKKLHAWFAATLPSATLGVIGPSEYSGWLMGGPAYISVDIDSSGIGIFNEAWGADSFWKVESWSYADWRNRVESAILLQVPLTEMHDNLRWWDIPEKGILLLDANTTGTFVGVEPESHTFTLSKQDAWWRLQQLFPEFAEMEWDDFPCGYFRNFKDGKMSSLLVIESLVGCAHPEKGWDSGRYSQSIEDIQRLKHAMCIPDGLDVRVCDGDF